jgi:predicted dehydrogenase
MRVGVIGAGSAGAMHARSLRGLDDAIVVAIAAATPEEAAPLAAEFGARVASASELCSAKDIDLVVVATPTHLHAEHAIAAARTGKHVFCEKPIARTRAQAEEMVRAADDAGVSLAVGHVVRFFPEYRQARSCSTPAPWAGPRSRRSPAGTFRSDRRAIGISTMRRAAGSCWT